MRSIIDEDDLSAAIASPDAAADAQLQEREDSNTSSVVVATGEKPVFIDTDPTSLPHFHPHMLEHVHGLGVDVGVVDSEWVKNYINPCGPRVRVLGGNIQGGFRAQWIEIYFELFESRRWLRLLLSEPLIITLNQESGKAEKGHLSSKGVGMSSWVRRNGSKP